MEVEERIVYRMPKRIMEGSARHRMMWTRHQIMRGVMAIRDKILKETGEDIFSAFIMLDCVEVNIKGSLQTTRVELLKTPIPKKPRRARARKVQHPQ